MTAAPPELEQPTRTPHELIQPAPFRSSSAQAQSPSPGVIARFAGNGRWKIVVAAVLAAVTSYYIATARSVAIVISPAADEIEVSGGLHFHLRDVYLLWSGQYRLMARRAGYEPLDVPLTVASANMQRLRFNLQKLGGHLWFSSNPTGARLIVDGIDRGTTPIVNLILPPGRHDVHMIAQDYAPYTAHIEVLGQGKRQQVNATLTPEWGWVQLTTTPGGAEIRLGERVLGRTSGQVRVPRGDQLLTLKLGGYKARQQHVVVTRGSTHQLPPLILERADGLVEVRSSPADAAVSVDGQYRGQSPLELALAPGRSYAIAAFKPGYRPMQRSVVPQPNGDAILDLPLALEVGQLMVSVTPADAELIIDGKPHGNAQQTVTLDARAHKVEIRKAGFVGYREQITPRAGFPQEIRLTLITTEQARRTSTAKRLVTATGQQLRLIYPGTFAMGSPPREPGHRPNETLHQVTLTRPYYLGVLEVSNAEFRKFQRDHNSSKFQTVDLNDDAAPAVNLNWFEAASYCNWLSAQERLPPFYDITNGVVSGYDPKSTGYRLPTEAEWEYAARHTDTALLRFPWGAVLPAPDRQGNYADRAASSLLGRYIIGYTDGYVGPAPVGRFPANTFGLKDLGGNVAEWINDFYAPSSLAAVTDPMGPDKGTYFVIKGASWMSASTTDLRLAFRDYAEQGRPDVGFRVARFAE